MRKTCAFLLLFALALALLPLPAARALPAAETPVRIGLYYGSSALPSANLQNVTGYGAGYQAGWFDGQLTFHPLAELSNVYLTIYPDQASHLDTGLRFSAFEEAAAYARSLGADAFPAWDNGSWCVYLGSYASYDEAWQNAGPWGYTPLELRADGFLIRDTQTGEILLAFRQADTDLAISPTWAPYGNEGAQTWFKGRKYLGRFAYIRNGDRLSVINVVNMEDYVRGVIPYEMSPSWPLEALKAQAICARTYAYANLGKHGSLGFDLCAGTDCQVYFGTNTADARTDQAVAETRGLCITYGGELITAYYYASNGGASENSENVWSAALPYLRAVRDDFEKQTNTSHTEWSYELTLRDITDILRQQGESFSGSIVNAWASYTEAGNIRSLTFVDEAGRELVIRGGRCRSLFNGSGSNIRVYSQRFIFEDKYAMRVQSCEEITRVGYGSADARPSAGNLVGLLQVDSASVLTGSGTVSGGLKYGTTATVITASGRETRDTVAVISGRSGFTSGTGTSGAAANLPIPASCSGTFVIRGSGNGHNVGMSQYGAKAMAELGYDYAQILRYYYTGVDITAAY